MHADQLRGMPVLVSFACRAAWQARYIPSFGRLLIDSGAYTAFNSGKDVSLPGFIEYAEIYRHMADHVAALDDIAGDWRKGLANWDQAPWMFPTIHDSDPDQALDAILERLQDPRRARIRIGQAQWIGIGMVPPRRSRTWLRRVLERIPEGVHVHGFALRGYIQDITNARGRDFSVDSLNWWLDARQVLGVFPYLTPAEAIEIVVKRYKREIAPLPQPKDDRQQEMFRNVS